MANYYFLLSALPPLSVGKPEISFQEFKDLLALNVAEMDRKKVKLLLRPIDLYNIRAFWLGLRLDDRGNLDSKYLEEALLIQDMLPPYVIDFLSTYESVEDRLRNFASLYVSLYRDELPDLDGFLLKLFQLERNVRLVLTALRAKKAKRDIVRELQFEDPSDLIVADILAQKDAHDYTPPQEFEDLKIAFAENSDDPEKLNRAILRYRLSKIDEMVEPQDFSIDAVLAYGAKLLLLEDVYGLSKEKGLEQLSKYD